MATSVEVLTMILPNGGWYIQGDEYVEITPLHIRLRKIHLDENTRKRMTKSVEAS